MRVVSSKHHRAWRNQLKTPQQLKRRQPKFSLRFPLTEYPRSKSNSFQTFQLKDDTPGTRSRWTKTRFIENGMPYRKLPTDGIVRGSFSLDGWNKLLQERLALGPMSPWEWETYEVMVKWTTEGVPDNADHLKPAEGNHNLTHEELQLSLDKLGNISKLSNNL